jgi:O-antigen/teichoic acid export membrane protein
MLVATAGVAIVIVAAREVLSALAGPAFAGGAMAFRLLLVASVGNAFAVLMSPQWINRGHLQMVSALTIGLGIVGLATSVTLVPRIGILGAAVATAVVYGLALSVNLVFYAHVERAAAAKGRSLHEKSSGEDCVA